MIGDENLADFRQVYQVGWHCFVFNCFPTKNWSLKTSPDCSGKPTAAVWQMQRSQARTWNGKRDRCFYKALIFRFKKTA